MKNIINGDFIYLNPDINQGRYRGLHGKRMEVLDLRHPWLEVENCILPLGEVVHEEDFLKAWHSKPSSKTLLCPSSRW